jgi:hypothetical protein
MKSKTIFSMGMIAVAFVTQTKLSCAQSQGSNITSNKTTFEKQVIAERSKVLFEENKGQVKDQHWQPRPDVMYYGQSEGMNFFIRGNGISYQLSRVDSWKEEEHPIHRHNVEKESSRVPDQITTYRVDINWVNAQIAQPRGQIAQPGYNNYYNVPDGVEPALNVKKYETLLLKNLWTGVDMEYYSRSGHLESDWIVQNAEDYKQIAFEVKGAELRIENGSLIMKTPLGEIVEGALKVEQSGRLVKSHWKLNGNTVSLELENYNPTEPLRIDPPVRIWGTYYGGSIMDKSESCTVDGNGSVYLAGYTESTAAIATTGAHQIICGGFYDAFLVKFNTNGLMQWATYYGGSDWDWGLSCTVNSNGDVYMAGYTESTTAIATPGSHQETYGLVGDAFLVKFDGSGIRQWGTYYGGSGYERGYSCVVDVSGNVFLSGITGSISNIATVGGHQITYGGDINDAFLVKFDGNGVRQWGTYYGGSDLDYAYSCVVDLFGDVYMIGYTWSNNGIATVGTHQTSRGGGYDAFLVKFDSNGLRQWGTYYGGSLNDYGIYCALDASGHLYLVGRTQSITDIATAGAYQTIHGGDYDAFLVKFNTNGQRQWGTYYGGLSGEIGGACVVDGLDNVYLAGSTQSLTNIGTIGAHQTTHGGGYWDAFLVKFDGSGVRQWSTYYGGAGWEEGYSCAVDDLGNVYLAGFTGSSNDIATSGVHQTSIGGFSDAFLVKFDGSGAATSTIEAFVEQSAFSIYPNPNHGQFTIQTEKGGVFELVNMEGKLINVYQVTANRYTNNENLPAGMYFIRERESGATVKLIVE